MAKKSHSTSFSRDTRAFKAMRDKPRIIEQIRHGYSGPTGVPTPEEQRALLARTITGDTPDGRAALQEVVVRNLPLVASIAKKYVAQSGMDFDDLVSEGVIGLIAAVRKFDLKRNLALSTYATWWVRQGITRALADQGTIIRRPVHAHEKIRSAQRIVEEFQQLLGEDFSIEECARRTGRDPEKLRAELLLGRNSETTAFSDMPEGFEDRHRASSVAPKQFSELLTNRARTQIEEALTRIDPREAKVIRERYGIGTGVERTLQEIGKDMRVSRERIRQLEVKAKRSLRRVLRVKGVLLEVKSG